jgi:hypothetical protein
MAGRRQHFPLTVLVAALAVFATGCGSSSKGLSTSGSASNLAPVHGHYSPSIRAASFVATVDNPLWPLEPGTAFHYEGVRGATPQKDDEVVTHETKLILGIRCTVVRDTVSERGRPIERTLDYYAQDKQGNVWYLGEDSFELQDGRFVKASDSWLSGIEGAKPGIIMPAHPAAGDSYRQEYYPPGEALDQAHVLGYRDERVQPARAADGGEVLRPRRRRDPGARRQGASRGVSPRQCYPLSRPHQPEKPDPNVLPFTGQLTEWFGGSFNRSNAVFHGTFHFSGTDANGNTLRVLDVSHANTTAAAPLGPPHSFEITNCG